jgi:L-malate glycosyltransferase
MRVLYVNQTAAVSGAERSLLDLLGALPADVDPVLACPDGPLAERVRALGVPWRRIPATDASFRLHPRHTTRALLELSAQGAAVRATARATRPRLVHANTTRAAISAVAARRLGGPPVVAHIRDWVPPGRAADLTLRFVAAGAAVTLANSRFAATQVAAGTGRVRVVHNPVDHRRFGALGRAEARRRLDVGEHDEVLAVIAQLTPWKGQAEAIEMVRLLRGERPRLRLLLVGSAKFTAPGTRFDNAGYAAELRARIAGAQLGDAVRLLGERDDVPSVMAALDLLLVPSWREAFGRVAAEALAAGVPVLATTAGGPAEIVRDGVDGRLLPPRAPAAWAAAVAELLDDPARRAAMGAAGRRRVREAFGLERHVRLVRAAYDEALAGGPPQVPARGVVRAAGVWPSTWEGGGSASRHRA